MRDETVTGLTVLADYLNEFGTNEQAIVARAQLNLVKILRDALSKPSGLKWEGYRRKWELVNGFLEVARYRRTCRLTIFKPSITYTIITQHIKNKKGVIPSEDKTIEKVRFAVKSLLRERDRYLTMPISHLCEWKTLAEGYDSLIKSLAKIQI